MRFNMISTKYAIKNTQLADLLPSIKKPMAYLGILILAESLTAFVEPGLGLLVHCALLAGLIYYSTVSQHMPTRRLLVSLTVTPLIRIVSLSLPLGGFDVIYWYLITAIPLFASIFIVRRALGFSWSSIGVNARSALLQVLIGSTGVAFGYVEYQILKPEPMVESLDWRALIVPGLIFLVATGFLEELLFRGIMQKTAVDLFSRFGIVYVAVIFAALHIGYQSVLDVAFVFAVGLFFGYAVYRTGSITGVTISHGLTNIMLFLVFPQ